MRLFNGFIKILSVVGLVLWGSLASQAAMAPFRIVIESGSPYYEPVSANINAGSPILWVNPTPSHHTVTHDGCVADGPCAFDSGPVPPDQKFSVPGLPPGRYPYHCQLHPIMRGIVIVTDPVESPAQL